MSKAVKKTTVNRTEAVAAINRSIKLLDTLKSQLRGKAALDGSTLDDLLSAAHRELRPLTHNFYRLRQEQFDVFMTEYEAERNSYHA